MTLIGHITEIKRYPVKSMRGEDLKEIFVNYSGLTGDRIYAFINPEKKDNFPWHSARQQHELILYTPHFRHAPSTTKQYPEQHEFDVLVQTPEGTTYAIDDPKFISSLEQKAETKFYLRFSEKGMQDARPISLISHDSIEALAQDVGFTLDPARFRANFYIRWKDQNPFFEDTLVNRHILIGDKLELRIVKKDPRCKVINLDPATAEHRPEVLRSVARLRRGCIGVYGAVIREGDVKTNDPITLID